MIPRFIRVEESIYRGGEPTAEDIYLLKKHYNVQRIISLDGGIAGKISPTVERYNIEHIVIPLTANETQLTSNLKYLQRNIVSLLTNKQPTFIHCLKGSDRTGLAIALYRVLRNGWKCEQAIAEAKKYEFGQAISPTTQELYKKILCSSNKETDQNASDDIEQEIRDQFSMQNEPFNLEQDSWGPRQDIYREPIDIDERTMELRKMIYNSMIDAPEIPSIGVYNNWSGIQGAGPTETGGFLNL